MYSIFSDERQYVPKSPIFFVDFSLVTKRSDFLSELLNPYHRDFVTKGLKYVVLLYLPNNFVCNNPRIGIQRVK